MNRLVIIGAGGHGEVLADIAKNCGYEEILFLDDGEDIKKCGERAVVGKTCEAERYKDSDFIVAIGNAKIRKEKFDFLEKINIQPVTLIHPKAVVAESAQIGNGTVVVAGAVINPYAKIGKGCIINTGSSIDHDCTVSDFCHIAIGANVAGTVYIGENTWIGAGATISNNISICGDCMIGAGAVVVRNIEEEGTYVGVPARKKYNL